MTSDDPESASPGRRWPWWQVLSGVAGVGVVGLFAQRFGAAGARAALDAFSPILFVAYLGVSTAAVIGYALRWRRVARTLGANPPLLPLVRARLAGAAVGRVVPSAHLAGEPLRVALTREPLGGTARAAASVATDRLLEAAGSIVCVVLYVLVAVVVRAETRPALVPVLTAALVPLGALGLVVAAIGFGVRPLAAAMRQIGKVVSTSASHPIAATIVDVEERLGSLLHENPGLAAAGLAASLGIEALLVVEHALLFAAFGIVLDLPTLLLVILGTGAAQAIPTPGGIGTIEGAPVVVMGLARQDPGLGFVIGLALRLHDSLHVSVGLAASAWTGKGPGARLGRGE